MALRKDLLKLQKHCEATEASCCLNSASQDDSGTFDRLLESCGPDSINTMTILLQHFYYMMEKDLCEMASCGHSVPKDCSADMLATFTKFAEQQENVKLNELSSNRVRIMSMLMATEVANKAHTVGEQGLRKELDSRKIEDRDIKNDLLKLETKLAEEQGLNQKLTEKLAATEAAMRKAEVAVSAHQNLLTEISTSTDGVKSHAVAALQLEYDHEQEQRREQSVEIIDLKREVNKLQGHVARLETGHAAYMMAQGSNLTDWYDVFTKVYSNLRPHADSCDENSGAEQAVRIYEIDPDTNAGVRLLVQHSEEVSCGSPLSPDARRLTSEIHHSSAGLAGWSAGAMPLRICILECRTDLLKPKLLSLSE